MPAGSASRNPVISNNTPLVALWVLRRLELLRDLYGTVLIPAAVHAEFVATESQVRQAALDQASWIEIRELKYPRRILAYTGLDEGEAAVLALAEEVDAGLILLDERKARRFARRLELPVTGTVGILLLGKERGKVHSVGQCLAALDEAGLHLGRELVHEALRLAGEADLDA